MLLNFVVPLNALLGIASFRFIREFHITLTETIQILLLYLPFSIISIIILRGFKKLLLFAVPFMTFTLFSSLVYLSFWHCGFIVLFFIFIFWQIFQENIVFVWPKFIPKKTRNLMKNAILFLFFCMLFVSVYKCLYQSIWDVIKPYDHSRLITKFIKEYKLENKVIFGQWIFFKPNGEIAHDIPTHLYVSNILPYFKRNIVNNLNFGDDKYPYDIHKVVNQKDYYKEWAKGPKPDIKIGINFTLDMIWPDITKEENDFIFVPLNEKENAVIWVRRDLAQELGLIDKILTMNKK